MHACMHCLDITSVPTNWSMYSFLLITFVFSNIYIIICQRKEDLFKSDMGARLVDRFLDFKYK